MKFFILLKRIFSLVFLIKPFVKLINCDDMLLYAVCCILKLESFDKLMFKNVALLSA
jgi:hypothetical protein